MVESPGWYQKDLNARKPRGILGLLFLFRSSEKPGRGRQENRIPESPVWREKQTSPGCLANDHINRLALARRRKDGAEHLASVPESQNPRKWYSQYQIQLDF